MALADSELINQFNNGNEQAFTELIERYQHKVYNTSFRMLGNHEDALDLAQESFIKVYQNLNRFKFNSSFSTWLFKITSNLCRDKLRKKQHILTTYSMSEDKINKKAMENIEKADNPENISISRQLSISIQEKIDQLSPKHKTVFVLREFEGLSYEEIAAVLEISVGTVKSRLSRARRSLREDLNKIIKDGGSK
jgi:RNA polymerase sigma-70 factor, ECF subfamily